MFYDSYLILELGRQFGIFLFISLSHLDSFEVCCHLLSLCRYLQLDKNAILKFNNITNDNPEQYQR